MQRYKQGEKAGKLWVYKIYYTSSNLRWGDMKS